MTTPLSYTIRGRDELSAILERLDRTVGKVAHQMDAASGRAREYGRALGSAEAPARRFQATSTAMGGHLDMVRSKAGAALTMLRSLAATAGVALAAAAGAAGAFGIKLAAANEVAEISFEVMLGSAEKAQAFLKELQAFAAATPFEMPQLRTAASRLLAVGTNAKDVIPLLTTLGDATAGMGTGAEGIERAVTALTQMRQKTKVSAEEMLQLTEAGIPAWESLAAVLHTDVAHAMKMVSDRQVDAQKMFDAIETSAGAGLKRLSGMMQRQSQTLAGLWSTFKDNAGQALAKFAEPAIPGMKRLVDFAGTALPQALDRIRGMGKQLSEIFKGSDVPGKLMASLDRLGSALLPKLEQAWDRILNTVRDNREGLEKLGRFIADVAVPVLGGMLITSIDLATSALQQMIIVASKVVDAIRALTIMMLSNIRAWIHGLAVAFGDLPLGIGEQLKKADAAVADFIASVNAKFDELDGRTVTVRVNAYQQYRAGERATASTADISVDIAPKRRAFGGRNMPGDLLMLGDAGSPELWYATQSGNTLSGDQTRRALAGRDETILMPFSVVAPDQSYTIWQGLLRLKRQGGKLTLGLA